MSPAPEPVKWCHRCPMGCVLPGDLGPAGVYCNPLARQVHSWSEAPHIPPADCPLRAGPFTVIMAADVLPPPA